MILIVLFLLISLFSSDLRTHIEQDRWSSAEDLIKKLEPKITTLKTTEFDSKNSVIINTKFYEYCRNNFIVAVNTENSSLKKLYFLRYFLFKYFFAMFDKLSLYVLFIET